MPKAVEIVALEVHANSDILEKAPDYAKLKLSLTLLERMEEAHQAMKRFDLDCVGIKTQDEDLLFEWVGGVEPMVETTIEIRRNGEDESVNFSALLDEHIIKTSSLYSDWIQGVYAGTRRPDAPGVLCTRDVLGRRCAAVGADARQVFEFHNMHTDIKDRHLVAV